MTGVPAAGHPRAGPRLRARRPRDPLLDARDHRARHRGRQRPLAHQPLAADRPRRALRLGPEPAARPEQRPGRRRHGRDPQQAARLPGRPGRHGGPRALRGGVGLQAPARARLAPVADVRRHGARRAQRRSTSSARTPRSPRPTPSARYALLEGLDFMIAQDILMTKTCEMADVVFPSHGVVVRVRRRDGDQLRAPRAADAQGDRPARARRATTSGSSASSRSASATTGASRRPRRRGTSCARSARCTRGMSYAAAGGAGRHPVAVPDEEHPGSPFLHGRLWDEPVGGPLAPFSVTPWAPPIDELDDDFPIRLTTGRRLDSYNTGVQSGLYRSPLRRGETLDLCAAGRREPRRRARRDRARSPRGAARSRRRCASTRACVRASPS